MTRISYHPVTMIASGAVVPHKAITYAGAVAGAAAVIRGFATTPAADGEAFLVDAGGDVPVLSGGAFNAGDMLETDANGDLVVQDAGPGVARALEDAAASGELRMVTFIPH